MNQPALFAAPPTAGTHRKSDRQTSVDAARAKVTGPDMARTLDALYRNGGSGTVDTVAAHFAALGIHRDRGPLFKRLSDLDDAGLIYDTDESVPGSRGRYVAVWALTDEGREAAS